MYSRNRVGLGNNTETTLSGSSTEGDVEKMVRKSEPDCAGVMVNTKGLGKRECNCRVMRDVHTCAASHREM